MDEEKTVDTYTFDLDDLIPAMIENVKDDIKGFDDLLSLDGALRREVYLFGINAGTGSVVEGQIRYWNQVDADNGVAPEDREPIKIYIDSEGGSLTDTFTIIDAIKMSKTPVITINMGCAYSGGFFIFICGHKRYAYKHSSFLFHEGSTGQAADAGKFRNFSEFYTKQLDILKDIVMENTTFTEEYYKEHQKDDLWLTPNEALELGVCDEIISEFII